MGTDIHQPADCSAVYGADPASQPGWMRSERPVPVFPGPHLLVDDALIRSASGIERIVAQPRRDPAVPNPLVTGAEDRCFQPFFTVSRRPEDGRWRLWYGSWRDDQAFNRSYLRYMESDDGIHWLRPARICDTPELQFGASVLDRGPQWRDSRTRYIYNYWLEGGLRLLASADGLAWRPLVDGIVLPHNHDINNIWRDPIRDCYVATISSHMESVRWKGRRRTTLQSHSPDLVHWTPPEIVLMADPEKGDPGETQFYAMSGHVARGPLVIAMVKVLRDDLKAAGSVPEAFGRAHTSLAWTRDGRHWVRDQAMYFEPADDPSAWDHAHAWVDEQVIVGDRVRLYYAGYRQGHKAERFTGRQIGLTDMPLDRYVARRSAGEGRLETVPLEVNQRASALTVNAVISGEVRAQILNADGAPLPGFGFAECRPVSGDGLRLPLLWGDEAATAKGWAALAGRRIRLAFRLREADLYAFEFQGPA